MKNYPNHYMKKSAAFSHVVFSFFFSFLFFLCFFRYLALPISLSFALAIAVACCSAALVAAFLGRKRQKLLFSLRAEREKNAFSLYLSLMPQSVLVPLLVKIFPEKFCKEIKKTNFSNHENEQRANRTSIEPLPKKAERLKNSAVQTETTEVKSVADNFFFFFNQNLNEPSDSQGQNSSVKQSYVNSPNVCGNNYAFFYFSAQKFGIDKSEILLRTLGEILCKQGKKNGVFNEKGGTFEPGELTCTLYCNEIEEEAAALLEKFDILILTIECIFENAQKNNLLPHAVQSIANENYRRKFRLRAISVKTARGLLISSGILLFSSLFSPFPYYYRAMGLLLFLLSIAVRLLAINAKLPAFSRKNARK